MRNKKINKESISMTTTVLDINSNKQLLLNDLRDSLIELAEKRKNNSYLNDTQKSKLENIQRRALD